MSTNNDQYKSKDSLKPNYRNQTKPNYTERKGFKHLHGSTIFIGRKLIRKYLYA